MGWSLTPGEDGFLISNTVGHISEPWGVILTQQKALKLIEWLEWGESVDKAGMAIVPKPPKPLPKRPVKRAGRK